MLYFQYFISVHHFRSPSGYVGLNALLLKCTTYLLVIVVVYEFGVKNKAIALAGHVFMLTEIKVIQQSHHRYILIY
jgi:hypothetical protein